MSAMHSVEVRGHVPFRAKAGEKLLEAALRNGVELPHDCRVGICGTCRVNVVAGSAEGGDTGDPSAVLACQARLWGDISIEVEDVPPVESSWGLVTEVKELNYGVVELAIEPRRWIPYLAGQYFQFGFKGFPTRSYSPTVPLLDAATPGVIRLHVRRVRDGLVSNAFGQKIQTGHKVKMLGPYGSAYLRSRHDQRLVLVGTGTGFAPVWSIAHQALFERPDREIIVLAGARSPDGLYMIPALKRLALYPRVTVVPFVAKADERSAKPLIGTAIDKLPPLRSCDGVYAAGSPDTVGQVMDACRQAGIACHADAFGPVVKGGRNGVVPPTAAEPASNSAPNTKAPPFWSPDALARRIFGHATKQPICVLVCAVESEAGPRVANEIATALGSRCRTAVVGSGVAMPQRSAGQSGFEHWHILPAPFSGPKSTDIGAKMEDEIANRWSGRVALEIATLQRSHQVVLISVPAMSLSTLAWAMAPICKIAIIVSSGNHTDYIATSSLRALGVQEIVMTTTQFTQFAAAG